jgi:hypothetical protein
MSAIDNPASGPTGEHADSRVGFRLAVLTGAAVVTLVVLAWANLQRPGETEPPLPGMPKPNPDRELLLQTGDNPNPIFTAQDAISRSLELFPPGHNPHGEITRLISQEVLDQWRGVRTNFDLPQAPAWLVGILGDNLTVGDFAPGGIEDTRPVEGAYYAGDANSGELMGEAVLGPQWPQNYASLAALVEQPFQIAPATPEPSVTPLPTCTPGPSPTPFPPLTPIGGETVEASRQWCSEPWNPWP